MTPDRSVIFRQFLPFENTVDVYPAENRFGAGVIRISMTGSMAPIYPYTMPFVDVQIIGFDELLYVPPKGG